MAAYVEAWRWAGIHCSSSPEPKLNIVTDDEVNNKSSIELRRAGTIADIDL